MRSLAREDRGILVTGAEATGSSFIAQTIARCFGEQKWSGKGTKQINGNKIIHRSIPFMMSQQYYNLSDVVSEMSGCDDIYIVICTRDIGFSNKSKQRRFGRTPLDLEKNHQMCKYIVEQIIKSGIKYFIWNYETMVFYDKIYFDMLYNFLNIDQNRVLPEIKNGNLHEDAD